MGNNLSALSSRFAIPDPRPSMNWVNSCGFRSWDTGYKSPYTAATQLAAISSRREKPVPRPLNTQISTASVTRDAGARRPDTPVTWKSGGRIARLDTDGTEITFYDAVSEIDSEEEFTTAPSTPILAPRPDTPLPWEPREGDEVDDDSDGEYELQLSEPLVARSNEVEIPLEVLKKPKTKTLPVLYKVVELSVKNLDEDDETYAYSYSDLPPLPAPSERVRYQHLPGHRRSNAISYSDSRLPRLTNRRFSPAPVAAAPVVQTVVAPIPTFNIIPPTPPLPGAVPQHLLAKPPVVVDEGLLSVSYRSSRSFSSSDEDGDEDEYERPVIVDKDGKRWHWIPDEDGEDYETATRKIENHSERASESEYDGSEWGEVWDEWVHGESVDREAGGRCPYPDEESIWSSFKH